MRDPTRLGEMEDPYIEAERVADAQDRALASLLMQAAFRDGGAKEREEFRILLRDN